jgi:lactoylglutathione lyase
MPDWLEQPGIVLLVEQYELCARFYRETVGLEVYADLGDLTVFRFGSAYLAVEQGGVSVPGGKTNAASPVTLRLNVADVDVEADRLRAQGVDVAVSAFDWGTIGKFLDPDGNRCELRNHFDGFFAPRRE